MHDLRSTTSDRRAILTAGRAVLCGLAILAFLAPAVAGAASTWQLTQLPARTFEGGHEEAQLSGVSCPTASLCVAVGGLDTIATSTSPNGGRAAWRPVYPTATVEPGKNCSEGGGGGPPVPCGNYLSGSYTDVSCASENLCVAVGFEGSAVASTDPTGGASAWSLTNVNQAQGSTTHLTGVSCPSTSLCVAVGGSNPGGTAGKVLTTTDPTSGRWQVTQLDSSLLFTGVSCAGTTLCVAVAHDGKIVVSADPAGGASAWRVVGTPGGSGDLQGVDCIASLCAAGNATGNILTSTDPIAGAWGEAKADIAALVTGVSCATTSACLGVDNNGSVFTSTDPTGGSAIWHTENLIPFEATPGESQFVQNALFGADCASTSLCVLAGSDSRIFTSTTPFVATAGPSGRSAQESAHRVPRRPKAFVVFAENFWRVTYTRRHHFRARFHFYSPTPTEGFECKRDRGRWRRCRSPLRYRVGVGNHVLRVRALGPTGLRGEAAVRHFVIRRFPHPPRAR